MIGGVFGRTKGIAPGSEVSLNYKKIEASITNEYVFDTTHKSGNFYYAWPELTYSPTEWFHVGAVAEHTVAYNSSQNVQRGFLVGSRIRNGSTRPMSSILALPSPTVVLEMGVNF